MSNVADLSKQVQDVIDGNVIGDEARAVLRAADLEVFSKEEELKRKRFQLERAESAVLYGPGRWRPSLEALGQQIGGTTVKLLQSLGRSRE